MADSNIRIAVILSAVDQMSSIISGASSRAQQRMAAISQKSFKIAAMSAAGAAASAAAIMAPIKAFADLEDSGLKLKAALMRDGGVVPAKLFDNLNKQAIQLGNKLPGTTADFQRLYTTLIQQGTPAQSILNGVGKAAAYLGIQLGMPMEETAILAARLRTQMGIADKDMMGFLDLIGRISNVGVSATEMQYAFGRSAGAMKLLGVQGLQASKSLGALFAILIRNGATGETAGTNVAKIMAELLNPTKLKAFNESAKSMGLSFKFFDKGKFLGVENFVAQLTLLQGMDAQKISKVLSPLTGGEGMDNQFLAALSGVGASGLNSMTASLSQQATMAKKTELLLTSLKNKSEAADGSFTNALATFGEKMAPMFKDGADYINTASGALQVFIQKHPVMTKYIGIALVALTAVLATLAVTAATVGVVTSGWGSLLTVFGLFSKAGPLVNTLILNMGRLLLGTATYIGRMSMVFFTRGIPAMASFTAQVWANAAAWLANPATYIILAIIAAVAALIAIGILVYKNWDKIMKWFGQQWSIAKAQVSGIISVFMMFHNVLAAVGKVMVGIWTFDPSKVVEGTKQAALAISKIQNGGVSLEYQRAYSQSMGGSGSIAPVSQKRINPAKGGSIHKTEVFQPIINLNGSADSKEAKKISGQLRSQWDIWTQDKEAKNNRLSFNNY